MIKMSTNIQYYCKLVAMGYEPLEAITLSYKQIKTYTEKITLIKRLEESPVVQGEIDRQREQLFNPIAIRRKVISLHNMCMDFNPSDCFEIKTIYNKDGVEIGERVKVKSISSWSPIARKLFKGFDKNGYPTFREPEKAMSELSRLYGFYKDTQSVVEDTDSVINGALGISPDVTKELDDLDSIELNELLKPYEQDNEEMYETVAHIKDRVNEQHDFSVPVTDSNITDNDDDYHYKQMMKTREWRKKKVSTEDDYEFGEQLNLYDCEDYKVKEPDSFDTIEFPQFTGEIEYEDSECCEGEVEDTEEESEYDEYFDEEFEAELEMENLNSKVSKNSISTNNTENKNNTLTNDNTAKVGISEKYQKLFDNGVLNGK